ncbi:DNA repair protein RadC [Phenylobacterium sp. LjRoot164]|uniref:JAB domain-containing protein n=1 Tax=unclassified Phenylobacterium TaxID=2640670 RepID=UPI003ECDFC7C
MSTPSGPARPADSNRHSKLIAPVTPDADLAARSDVELLELLLRGHEFDDAARQAKVLIEEAGGLTEVVGRPRADLQRLLPVNLVFELRLAQELAIRMAFAPLRETRLIATSPQLATYLKVLLAAQPREQVWGLYLDARDHLLASEMISQGTVDHAPVYPREIVRRALELNAAALVLVHNHPSGDPTPSRADIEMTAQVIAAAGALTIKVHDHLVVGRDGVASLRTLGLM